MLKALELYGFKSFADKTRFEFPLGITVVVGPNGSGKSNIVDAIKWVLGEQSAKSLRGREMADVIFKGSGGTSTARRPSNSAEVAIIFDNAKRQLSLETDEVRVSRRVYRSGEGEYAINGNPCRLRDIKDMFRGTGIGTDAYSLIEQGKVDTLLQASPRDRRAIFEEAAGISRFKVKKVETQRRLERVQQNLERLSDIVDEVESQLRSVRNQASKARRYKAYSDRLRELRTHIGGADWRRFSNQLEQLEAERARGLQRSDELQNASSSAEQRIQAIEEQSARLEDQLHECEAQSVQTQQDLTRYQSSMNHEFQRIDELDHEIGRYRRQWQAMTTRAGDLGIQLQQLREQVGGAQQEDEAIRQRLQIQQASLDATEKDLEARQRLRDEQRDEHAHQLRLAGDVSRRIGMLESELQGVDQQIERATQQRASIETQLRRSSVELEELAATEQEMLAAEETARSVLNQARDGLHGNERQLNRQQQKAVDLQRRFTVASERANMLQESERRNEGLSPGVKDLLAKAQDTPLGPMASVRGMVADLIRVDVRMAPLIDAALGEMTQFVVVEGQSLVEQIASGDFPLQGRVGVIDLESAVANVSDPHELKSDRTVIGRADQFVDADKKYEGLIRALLGQTWCVETLRDALRLQSSLSRRVRFVTRSGEILESDGRLLAGPRQAALGLVSRRSELRSLQSEIVALEPQLKRTEDRIDALKTAIKTSEQDVHERSRSYDEAASELMNSRLARRAAADRVAALDEQKSGFSEELERQVNQRHEVLAQRQQQLEKIDHVNAMVGALEQQLSEQQEEMVQLQSARQRELTQLTEIKVELAKSEQQFDSLSGQLIRFQEDQRDRQRALDEARTQMQTAQARHVQSQRTLLKASSVLAELYLRSERHKARFVDISRNRSQLLDQRGSVKHELTENRRQLQDADEHRHKIELDINRLQLEREALAERVRDDYQIELSDISETPKETEGASLQRDEIDREIGELRRRLSNIGAVNMAALDEIEGLEGRHQDLAAQYQDLVDAKDALARIIHKINADSRRLFTESLEAIRTHFQSLFRRVFGGGKADIVLEEGMDILEAGIDIIATPPGKHSLGISLLSGGERALTAVTLLLAIFQYRPSPFCVLDEVDGPLDEANIGRFVDVLNEFLQWTKFVVVTHSKKTMTAAHTLYGVTMQESGVSKRVSVRFEDVSEDGHIRQEVLERDRPSTSDESPEGGDDERGAA